MPDLANLALSSSSSSLTLTRCASSLKPLAPPHSATESPGSDSAVVKTLALTGEEENVCAIGNGNSVRVMKRCRGAKNISGLEDHVAAWVKKKMELGVPQSNCSLPFLVGAKKMVYSDSFYYNLFNWKELKDIGFFLFCSLILWKNFISLGNFKIYSESFCWVYLFLHLTVRF